MWASTWVWTSLTALPMSATSAWLTLSRASRSFQKGTSEEQQSRGGMHATDMELRNHLKNKCQQCGKSFKRSDFLKQHQRLVHMKVRNHACDICGKRFGHKGHITRHRECVHSGKKRGSICHYVHQSQVNKLRVKNRQGRKKIKMDKCQTQDRGRLRRHLRH